MESDHTQNTQRRRLIAIAQLALHTHRTDSAADTTRRLHPDPISFHCCLPPCFSLFFFPLRLLPPSSFPSSCYLSYLTHTYSLAPTLILSLIPLHCNTFFSFSTLRNKNNASLSLLWYSHSSLLVPCPHPSVCHNFRALCKRRNRDTQRDRALCVCGCVSSVCLSAIV